MRIILLVFCLLGVLIFGSAYVACYRAGQYM